MTVANAADAPKAPPSAAKPCELHVWPAAAAHSSYVGWFHGGAVDGDKRGIKGYPEMYTGEVDMAHQVAAFRQIDWNAWADAVTYVVTVHESATGADDDRLRATRLVPGDSACYREFIVSSVLIEAATFSSRSVRLVGLMKKFDASGQKPSTFTSMVKADLVLPDKSSANFEIEVRKNTREAFAAAVNKFMVAQSFH